MWSLKGNWMLVILLTANVLQNFPKEVSGTVISDLKKLKEVNKALLHAENSLDDLTSLIESSVGTTTPVPTKTSSHTTLPPSTSDKSTKVTSETSSPTPKVSTTTEHHEPSSSTTKPPDPSTSTIETTKQPEPSSSTAKTTKLPEPSSSTPETTQPPTTSTSKPEPTTSTTEESTEPPTSSRAPSTSTKKTTTEAPETTTPKPTTSTPETTVGSTTPQATTSTPETTVGTTTPKPATSTPETGTTTLEPSPPEIEKQRLMILELLYKIRRNNDFTHRHNPDIRETYKTFRYSPLMDYVNWSKDDSKFLMKDRNDLQSTLQKKNDKIVISQLKQSSSKYIETPDSSSVASTTNIPVTTTKLITTTTPTTPAINTTTGPWRDRVIFVLESLEDVNIEISNGDIDHERAYEMDQYSDALDDLVAEGQSMGSGELNVNVTDLDYITALKDDIDMTQQDIHDQIDDAQEDKKEMIITLLMLSILFVVVLIALVVSFIRPWAGGCRLPRTKRRLNAELGDVVGDSRSFNTSSYRDQKHMMQLSEVDEQRAQTRA